MSAPTEDDLQAKRKKLAKLQEEIDRVNRERVQQEQAADRENTGNRLDDEIARAEAALERAKELNEQAKNAEPVTEVVAAPTPVSPPAPAPAKAKAADDAEQEK